MFCSCAVRSVMHPLDFSGSMCVSALVFYFLCCKTNYCSLLSVLIWELMFFLFSLADGFFNCWSLLLGVSCVVWFGLFQWCCCVIACIMNIAKVVVDYMWCIVSLFIGVVPCRYTILTLFNYVMCAVTRCFMLVRVRCVRRILSSILNIANVVVGCAWCIVSLCIIVASYEYMF